MMRSWKRLLCLAPLAVAVSAQGQFKGLMDRVGDRVSKTIEDRMGDTSDKAVDAAFDGADGAVDCTAGDPNCGTDTTAPAAAKPAAPDAAKCLATDAPCLRDAKARGQMVQIVSEDEVDTLRCSSSDRDCLQRAQQLGKKVEITE